MRTTLSAILAAGGLAAALALPVPTSGAQAATRHRVDCSNPANAQSAACTRAMGGQREIGTTGSVAMPPPAAMPAGPPNVLTGLDCNNTPQNLLEYYCNHRDQYPGK